MYFLGKILPAIAWLEQGSSDAADAFLQHMEALRGALNRTLLLGLHELGPYGWRWFAVDVVWATGAGLGTGDGSTIPPADAFGSPDGLAFDNDGRRMLSASSWGRMSNGWGGDCKENRGRVPMWGDVRPRWYVARARPTPGRAADYRPAPPTGARCASTR